LSPLSSSLVVGVFILKKNSNDLKDTKKTPKEQANTEQAEPKRSFKPRLGYDKDGKQMNSAGVRYQISAVAKKLPMDYTINYLAEGEERAQIFVFTDPTCPYCRKLHKDMSKFTQAGITVRYMFYPRAGYENNPVVTNMQGTWCSSDQRAAMDNMKAGYPVRSLGCDITEKQKEYGDIVAQHMMLAKFFEISGTPTVFSSEGGLAVGYSNAAKMIEALGYGNK
jgi:thioredoxin-related protein